MIQGVRSCHAADSHDRVTLMDQALLHRHRVGRAGSLRVPRSWASRWCANGEGGRPAGCLIGSQRGRTLQAARGPRTALRQTLHTCRPAIELRPPLSCHHRALLNFSRSPQKRKSRYVDMYLSIVFSTQDGERRSAVATGDARFNLGLAKLPRPPRTPRTKRHALHSCVPKAAATFIAPLHCFSWLRRSIPPSTPSLPHPRLSGTLLCFPSSPPMAFTSLASPLRARRVPARCGAAAVMCTASPAGPPVSRRTALTVAAAGLLAVGLGGPALPVAAYSSRTQNDLSNAAPTRYVVVRRWVQVRGWDGVARM